MKYLSISIAAYNVEKYLSDFLSNLSKSKHVDDIEVLVVNDGSIDLTGEIADRFHNEYPKTFFHIRKENGGHGSTITAGIKHASGKYFYVIDGDDNVDISSFDVLVNELKTASEDCILLDYVRKDDKSGAETIVRNGVPESLENMTSGFDTLCKSAKFRMPTMVIRTEILKANDIRIDEHRFFTDKEYIFFALPHLNTFKYIPISVYVYRTGMVTQSMSIVGTRKHNPDREFISYRLAEFFEDNSSNFTPSLRNYLCKNIGYSYVATVNGYMNFKWTDMGVRKRLVEYDKAFRAVSPFIYDEVFKEGSVRIRKLKILKKTKFWGWRLFSFLGNVKRDVTNS